MTVQGKGALRTFPGIDYQCFTHPLDRRALDAVRRIPGIDVVLKKVFEFFPEKAFRLICLSDNIRLSPRQGSKIYSMFEEAARILDLPKVPEQYMHAKYEINAFAFGVTDYTVTLYSGLVDMMTDEELMAILGHELGHIKCQHMLYKTLTMILAEISGELIKATMGIG